MPICRWTAVPTSRGLRTGGGYCEVARGRTTPRSAALRTATALRQASRAGRAALASGWFARSKAMNLNPAVGGIARGAESAETTAMGTETTSLVVHPEGEQPAVEAWSAVADTYAGRVHVEWDATAPVTPFGQLPFFIEYLKQGGLFDGWVADCPLSLSSPNAPRKRDLLGTVLLSVLAGHRRYAHITALRCDPVNPPARENGSRTR